MHSIICLDGEFVPESEARISVFDHGFLYGDGIFESLTATRRRVFRLDQHVARLFRSAAFIHLAMPFGPDGVKAAVLETLRRNDRSEAYIRIVVSRGPGYPLLDPRVAPAPTFVVFIHDPAPPPTSQAIYAPHPEGLKVIISSTRKDTVGLYRPQSQVPQLPESDSRAVGGSGGWRRRGNSVRHSQLPC